MWHVAILHNGLIFERNSIGKNICPFPFWEFKNEPSIIVTNVKIDRDLLYSQINYPIDCATYVARVVGMDRETLFTDQKNKNIYPIDILNWLISRGYRWKFSPTL